MSGFRVANHLTDGERGDMSTSSTTLGDTESLGVGVWVRRNRKSHLHTPHRENNYETLDKECRAAWELDDSLHAYRAPQSKPRYTSHRQLLAAMKSHTYAAPHDQVQPQHPNQRDRVGFCNLSVSNLGAAGCCLDDVCERQKRRYDAPPISCQSTPSIYLKKALLNEEIRERRTRAASNPNDVLFGISADNNRICCSSSQRTCSSSASSSSHSSTTMCGPRRQNTRFTSHRELQWAKHHLNAQSGPIGFSNKVTCVPEPADRVSGGLESSGRTGSAQRASQANYYESSMESEAAGNGSENPPIRSDVSSGEHSRTSGTPNDARWMETGKGLNRRVYGQAGEHYMTTRKLMEQQWLKSLTQAEATETASSMGLHLRPEIHHRSRLRPTHNSVRGKFSPSRSKAQYSIRRKVHFSP